MSDHRRKLDEYIKASDKRVETWSAARKEAFQEAVNVINRTPHNQSQSIQEPPKR
jgi:hypothetical protein